MNSFYFLNISLPQSELQHFAGKCAMNASDAVISQDDIAIKTDANLILPSRCDGINLLLVCFLIIETDDRSG